MAAMIPRSCSLALMIACLFISETLAGLPLPIHGGGGSAGVDERSSFDKWKRGAITDSHANSQDVQANSIQKVFDRSKSAREAMKTAEIAQGYLGAGGSGHGSGSSGAENNLLTNVYDRGSFDADKFSIRKANEKASASNIDSGFVKSKQATDVNIAGLYGHGGLYGSGASSGFSNKVLEKQRNLSQDSDVTKNKYYKDAEQSTEKFDRGKLVKAGASSAAISQGAGYDLAGTYGLYGSRGDETQRLLQTKEKGFINQKKVAEGAARVRALDHAHDNERVLKSDQRSSLIGPYGSSGAGNAAKLIEFSKGKLQKREADSYDREAFEKTKHLTGKTSAAANDASVRIGQGAYGQGSSSGAQKASSSQAVDTEFEKVAGVKSKSRSASSTIRTFDDGVKQAARKHSAVINPVLARVYHR